MILRKVLNGALFYIGWFICLSSAVQGRYDYIPFLVFALGVHFFLTRNRPQELILMITVVSIGFVLDTLYIVLGICQYSSPNEILVWAAPPWILGIYALFSTSINQSLSWLGSSFWLAALFGAIGGAFSYGVGGAAGAVEFTRGTPLAMVVIGTVWFVAMPGVIRYSRWLQA